MYNLFTGVDYGLDDDPLWLSRYIQSSCQNKVSCNPVMPLFWQITTSTKFERGQPTCILGQLKYFLSARVHLECRGTTQRSTFRWEIVLSFYCGLTIEL